MARRDAPEKGDCARQSLEGDSARSGARSTRMSRISTRMARTDPFRPQAGRIGPINSVKSGVIREIRVDLVRVFGTRRSGDCPWGLRAGLPDRRGAGMLRPPSFAPEAHPWTT
ncbi:hypothetical protein [Azospirillum argentinense]